MGAFDSTKQNYTSEMIFLYCKIKGILVFLIVYVVDKNLSRSLIVSNKNSCFIQSLATCYVQSYEQFLNQSGVQKRLSSPMFF